MFGNLMKGRRRGTPKTDVKANELVAPIREGPPVSGPRPLRTPGGPRSRKAPVNAHSAFQRASLRKRIREKRGHRHYLNEVTVLGERVKLNEEGVSHQELARNIDFADFVHFTNKYFPPPTSEEGFTRINEAKEVFSLIFHPAHGFNENEPLPPCADKDFSILKDCIEYRIGTLRDDVLAREQKYGDSVYTRQGVEHFLRLKKLSDELNTAEGCRYYDSKSKGASSGRRIDNIDQERFENLLRQFSFLILQAMHPVKGYTQQNQIDPVDFVKQLETDPIRSDDFMEYLAEYEQTHAQIPPVLAKILDVTGTENGVFNLVLEGKAKQIFEDIEKIMMDTLKGKLLSDFQIEMARVKELTHRERIQFSIKWLLDRYSGCIDQVAALQEERRALGEERNQLQRELGNLKGREEGLEGEVATAVASQEAAMAAAAATGPQVESANRQLDAAREETVQVEENAEASIERLKAELLGVQEERKRLEGALRETDGKIKAAADKHSGELKQIREILTNTQLKLVGSLSQNKRYEAELSKLKSELATASAQQSGLTQKKEIKTAGLDREISVLEARLADKMTELSALQGPGAQQQGGNAERVANINREIAEIDRKLTAKRTERLGDADEMGKQLELKTKEIEGLNHQINQLQGIIKAAKESAPKPSKDMEKEQLRRELDAAKRGFESRHAMYEDLNRRHEELVGNNRRLTGNIATLQNVKSTQNSTDAATTQLQIQTLEGELERAKGEQGRMAEELGAKKGEIEALRAQLAERGVELSNRSEATAHEVAAAVTASTAANKAEEDRLRATIADLTAQIGELRAAPAPLLTDERHEHHTHEHHKHEHEEKIRGLEAALAAANGTLAALEATIATKQGNELELKRTVEEQAAVFGQEKAGLLSKVTQMAQAIENKSLSRETANRLFAGNEAFMNLYNKIMEYTSNSDKEVESKDICFLNYFITFFIKQLFFTGAHLEEKKGVMKQLIATIDASPFASSPKDLEAVLYQIYDLLYSSETFFLTQQRRDGVPTSLADEGYYVLKDNNKEDVSKMIEFYHYIRDNGDIDGISKSLNRYIPEAFPDYFFKGSSVHFAFPTSESEELILNYPGFVFLRGDAKQPLLKQRYMVIDKSNYSKSEERVEDGPVKQYITEMITGSKVDYTLLFTLFILVSRKYLLSIQSELEKYQCGITQYIRDPDSIVDSASAATGHRRGSLTHHGVVDHPIYRGDFAGLTDARRRSISSVHPPPLHVKGIPRPQ
jgi:predicted  nucleic acid-binding Zn-ribbon protein